MAVKWLPLVVHPQTGEICDALRLPDFWPDGGFPVAPSPEVRVWPVPWLKGARLVDCRCGKTGIQAATPADLARYVPGAKLNGDGSIVLASALDAIALSDGSGRDEETVSDRMVDKALAVLAAGWVPVRAGTPPARISVFVTDDVMQQAKQFAQDSLAADKAVLQNREYVRRAIKAALEALDDCHRS
jgi:hypothetical protein